MQKQNAFFIVFFAKGLGERKIEYQDLLRQRDAINELLARYGVKFGIYKNNTFYEQLFTAALLIERLKELEEKGIIINGHMSTVIP